MRFVFYAILLYLLYQFIFKLVIPVYVTTKKVKKGFREMQSKMKEHMQQQQSYAPQQEQPTSPKYKAGDYIEFEEVK
jgi:hypothetical protein